MADTGWHLDKKVPIALIIAIIVQTAVAVAFIARLDSRVSHLEEADSRAADENVSERLAVVESQLVGVGDTTDRIERKVDSLIDRNGR